MRFLARLSVLCAALLWSGAARAECGGTDLIDALPDADRAALQARADAVPYGTGLLWQAQKGDRVIRLFGTYHLRHDGTEAQLKALKPLITSADRVYLELSAADNDRLSQVMATDRTLMFLPDGPGWPERLGEAEWARFAQAASARGLPGPVAARVRPLWATMVLGMSPCEIRAGIFDQPGIDDLIGRLADSDGPGGVSLEDYRTSFELLDDMSEEDQTALVRVFLDWPGDPDDQSYTLRRRYLRQETALIWELGEWQASELGVPQLFARFEDRLLTRRNRAWVQLIEADSAHTALFVAVGAAHLPGETGVLTLLRDAGYEITRLPFAP